MFAPDFFDEVRKEFMTYLRYTKGHSKMTCYNYHSDLNIWGHWLQANGKDWQHAQPADVERFMTWELQDQGVGVPITLLCDVLAAWVRSTVGLKRTRLLRMIRPT